MDYSELEENEFIRLAKNKQISYDLVQHRYSSFIWDVVNEYYVAGQDEDDLYSELSFELYKAVDSFDETKGYSFMTYLGTCMHNRISSLITRSKLKKHGAETYNKALRLDKEFVQVGAYKTIYRDVLLTTNETEQSLEEAFLFNLVNESINNLEPNCKYVLIETIKDKTQRKIANELNVTQTTVKDRLKKGRNIIKKELKRAGIDIKSYF